MIQHGDKVIEAGDVLDYEEFRRVVVLGGVDNVWFGEDIMYQRPKVEIDGV